jgi:hypothetical protein
MVLLVAILFVLGSDHGTRGSFDDAAVETVLYVRLRLPKTQALVEGGNFDTAATAAAAAA